MNTDFINFINNSTFMLYEVENNGFVPKNKNEKCQPMTKSCAETSSLAGLWQKKGGKRNNFLLPLYFIQYFKKRKMKKIMFSVIVFAGLLSVSFAQENAGLKIGDKAPEFKTLADDGSVWDSKSFVGEKYVVVYFYPAAMTGGCTKQACAYRDLKTEIESADAVVVGVSGDNVEGLKIFKKANDLNFTLLSDENGEIAHKFGVPTREGGTITREINGQNFDLVRGTTASRWTFIIDKQGKIVYKNEQVDASKDTEEVLSFIKNKR